MIKYKFYSISRCKSFYAIVYSLCTVIVLNCVVVYLARYLWVRAQR